LRKLIASEDAGAGTEAFRSNVGLLSQLVSLFFLHFLQEFRTQLRIVPTVGGVPDAEGRTEDPWIVAPGTTANHTGTTVPLAAR
jgi:hypothetical protein